MSIYEAMAFMTLFWLLTIVTIIACYVMFNNDKNVITTMITKKKQPKSIEVVTDEMEFRDEKEVMNSVKYL